ncbi:hypothetical protein EDC04DRAFT_2901314 [Pisolithus marmoratus]|nr:hypothetical protein EDC04DRAFT_2901314 [Pisolithus marmoratus]
MTQQLRSDQPDRNTGPSHSGTAVGADNKSEQRTGTHANEDKSKLLAVSPPEGVQGARKPDAVPLSEQIKPTERTANEDPAQHRPIEITEIKNNEDVSRTWDTPHNVVSRIYTGISPGNGSETLSVRSFAQAPGDIAAHHGTALVVPLVVENPYMSKSTCRSVSQPSGVLRGKSSNLSFFLDQPASVIPPSENSQIAANSARILSHLRSDDGTRAPRQVSRIVDQVEKNSKIVDDALHVVKYSESKARELKDRSSVNELKKFIRGFWNAIVEVKASFEEATSPSRLIADETRQTVDQLMEQAKKDVDSAAEWTFSGAIACATVIGIPVGLVMFGRASRGSTFSLQIYNYIFPIDESDLGQQREKDANHLDGIRKDTDSLATQMGRTTKWWSALAEYISDIKA